MIKGDEPEMKMVENSISTELNEEELKSLLHNLGKIGANKAASALSEMILKDISIRVARVNIVSPMEMPDLLQTHGLQSVVIIEQLSKKLECDLLLVFSLDESKTLVKLFLDAMGMDGLEESDVMQEIGNILIGNFLNAFSDYAKIPLKPTPPRYYVDYFDAILDNYITRLLYDEKNVTLFDTSLKCSGVDIKGLFLMFLGEEILEKLTLKSKVKSANSAELG